MSCVFQSCFQQNSAATSTTETCRPIEVVSEAQFKRGLASDTTVYLGFIEQVSEKADYHHTHRAAHGSAAKGQNSAKSDQLLDELKQDYPTVFFEPTYPVWEHHTPFSIPLIDERVQPKQRRLYHLSESKLVALQKQIKVLTNSGQIVPSSSPYGHPIIFTEKKGRAGLRIYIEYCTINSNTITDAWPLPRIDKLLGRLRGAKVFSKLGLRDGYHQIPVELKDHYKMALSYRYSSFKFTIIQFGFKNAPSDIQHQYKGLAVSHPYHVLFYVPSWYVCGIWFGVAVGSCQHHHDVSSYVAVYPMTVLTDQSVLTQH